MSDDLVVREWDETYLVERGACDEHNALVRAYRELWEDIAHLEKTRAEIQAHLTAMTASRDSVLSQSREWKAELATMADYYKAQLAAMTAELDTQVRANAIITRALHESEEQLEATTGERDLVGGRMTKLVEKMARAICEGQEYGPAHLDQARAALAVVLEALQEPSEEMMREGADYLPITPYGATNRAAGCVFEAMLAQFEKENAGG